MTAGNLGLKQEHKELELKNTKTVIGIDSECAMVKLEISSASSCETTTTNNENKQEYYINYVNDLRLKGKFIRSDRCQPSVKRDSLPNWFDDKLFNNAKLVYANNFMGINFAHFSGLILLVRSESIFNTLNSTGCSSSVSKLFRRYYNTVSHVKSWYEGDIFEIDSKAHNSLLIVRGMHNKVSKDMNDNSIYVDNNNKANQDSRIDGKCPLSSIQQTNNNNNNNSFESCRYVEETKPAYLSQYDIMITQFAFIGLILNKPKFVGLLSDSYFTEYDAKSVIHFWRVIGFFLGASDKYNLGSYPLNECKSLCDAFFELEFKQSMKKHELESEPGLMSINIVRSLKFLPLLTVYGMMRYLNEVVGYKPSNSDSNTIDGRKTWFSSLSYTLMRIVMTSFLGFKPLRMFNNGLTRLSLYLIGKFESWYCNRLNSRYGSVLTT